MNTSSSRTFSTAKYGSSRAKKYGKAVHNRDFKGGNYSRNVKPRTKFIENVEKTYDDVQKTIKANKAVSVFGMLIVLAGILFGIFTYYQNQQVIEVVEEQIAIAEQSNNNSTGSDSPQPSLVIPSTNKPSIEDVMKYTAAANRPKRIEINSIEVFARVGEVSENVKGEVGVPVNVYDAAWYSGSSVVGENPGSSVIVGHVGFRSVKGVFATLDKVKGGDIITITMGDDRVFNYKTVSNDSIKLDNFSMSNYLSYNNVSTNVLHLITCSGSIIPGTHSFDSRQVVSAELIK